MGCGVSGHVSPQKPNNIDSRGNVPGQDQEHSLYTVVRWKQFPSPNEAQQKFLNDGTLVASDITPDKIEFRTLLDDPYAQAALGKYAGGGMKNLDLFMCWCDIQEYKSIPTESYRRSKALHIFHKYVKAGAVLSLKILTSEDRDLYKSRLDASKIDPAKLRFNFYDKLQYSCFLGMLDKIYVPFKRTEAFEQLSNHLKDKYNRVKLSHFEFYDMLGEGAFGFVVHCKKRSTGKHYAMKIQTKRGLLDHCRADYSKIYTEKMAFASCQHPFIVNLDYAFQTDSLAILVLGLATGGDLARAIKSSEQFRLSEERVRFYAAEMVLALSYMHQMGLVYRDLKPQNVLLHEGKESIQNLDQSQCQYFIRLRNENIRGKCLFYTGIFFVCDASLSKKNI